MWVDWVYYCIAKVQKGRNFVKKKEDKKEEETIFNFTATSTLFTGWDFSKNL